MRHLVLGASILLSACGPSGRDGGNGGQVDAAIVSNDDAPPVTDTSRVYAHSGSTLYQLNTATLAPITIGTMSGLGTQSLTDLAIDKNDVMVGITLNKLYTVDSTTGAATLLKDLSTAAKSENFTSLSFVPADLNDPNSDDILVAASSTGGVFEIDKTTGDAMQLGDYGTQGSDQIGSSGDLIGVRGLGIYATVNVGTSPTANDYLARIDPTDWHAEIVGTASTGFNNIFGLAYWQGQIYGFVSNGTSNGQIITIDPTTGVGTEVQSSAVNWFGAGVATDAPVIQ